MNPAEQLKDSNDAYHEATQRILCLASVDVNVKAQFASTINTIFRLMSKVQNLIDDYIGE